MDTALLPTAPSPERLEYRGKRFYLPPLSSEGHVFEATTAANRIPFPVRDALTAPILDELNSVWDLKHFRVPRRPVSLGLLTDEERAVFGTPNVPRVLDMPIKFPGSSVRLPKEHAQFRSVIERILHFEAALNGACLDEYYCYLTVDQGTVRPDTLQREAPCHVDGFQGARWSPKVRINHTYVVSDSLPTTYYVQPFDFSALDEARHNFFWEMNRQVAQTRSAYAWRPQENEINLIDAYTVHRGSEAAEPTFRTWIRLSFEVRQFDRLGNAHNPMFRYDWPMVKRDIEGLDLVAFDETSDVSLRVFPWQTETGEAHADVRNKTKPLLLGDKER
jgi:hypothetical protein